MKKNPLNLAILISCSLHASGFFLFSIVVPSKEKSFSPIEVVLVKGLPATKSEPMLAIKKTKIFPSLPKKEEKEKVSVYLPAKRFLSKRIMATETSFAGEEEFLPLKKFLAEKSEISLPSPPLPKVKVGQSFSNSGIYGPGGNRRLLFKVLPDYPRWAEEKGIECALLLKLWILPDGSVEKVDVKKSSGYPRLDFLSAEFARKWRFNPVPNSEKVWGMLPLKFRLK